MFSEQRARIGDDLLGNQVVISRVPEKSETLLLFLQHIKLFFRNT